MTPSATEQDQISEFVKLLAADLNARSSEHLDEDDFRAAVLSAINAFNLQANSPYKLICDDLDLDVDLQGNMKIVGDLRLENKPN